MEKFVSSMKNCKKNAVLLQPHRKTKYNQLKNKLKTIVVEHVLSEKNENGDQKKKLKSKTEFEKVANRLNDLVTVVGKTLKSDYKIPKLGKLSKKPDEKPKGVDKAPKKGEYKPAKLKKKNKLKMNNKKVSVVVKPKKNRKKMSRLTAGNAVAKKVTGKENSKSANVMHVKQPSEVNYSSPSKILPGEIALKGELYHSMMETTASSSVLEECYENEVRTAVDLDSTSSPVVVQRKRGRTVIPYMMQDVGEDTQVRDDNFNEEFSSVLSCFRTPENKNKMVVRGSNINSHINELALTLKRSRLSAKVKRPKTVVDKSSSFELHSLPGRNCVMTMRHPSEVCVQGKVKVTVLKGTVEVLGFKLTPENSKGGLDVFSPRRCMSLSISSHKLQEEVEDMGYIKKLEGLKASYAKLINKCLASDCVVLLQETRNILTSFINIHFPLNLFPKVYSSDDRHFHREENRLQCQLTLPGDDTDICHATRLDEWEQVISDMSVFADGSKTVVLGGKGVGKSTFLRFLANSCLTERGAVLWLDFDPGQAEFTVPGCLSAVLVKEPLLGPNFTHLTTPLRMIYLGEIDVSRCPSRYNSCVQDVINYCSNQPDLQNIPWFVNTMGFCTGLGVELAINIIRSLRPTNVIHIESKRRMLNFAQPLTSSYVNNFTSTWSGDSAAPDLDYATQLLASVARSSPSSAPGLKPRDSRELMVLAYLSQVVRQPRCSLLSVVPYCSKLSKLALGVCHEVLEPAHVLGAMNGGLVALCTSEHSQLWVSSVSDMASVFSQVPIAPCLGFGIVRGVDMAEKSLYLTTPLGEEHLSQVNCLLMGAVSVPPHVYFAVEPGAGRVPYVSSNKEQAAMNRSTRRSFRRIVNP